MTASIGALKASDGSGNASLATVQSTRAALSTTIVVDTVTHIPTNFYASMGTPHTFVDPVTSETITVISEATAVDFKGHVDTGNLIIDTIAPGYTDAGSAIGDVVMIRPTTQWADNLAAALDVSMNDDGSLDGAAVRTALGETVPTGPGWTDLAHTPNTVTANGNRSYSLVFNGIDLTGTVSAGMRLKIQRTVAAPTQCTSLNGTTQYYSKTSPAGMTFTDDFTASAWIKLAAYNGSVVQNIASRYNGTSGWRFDINTNGQIELVGFNAGSANLSYVSSYQAVPFNKWVHVAVQLDMSSFTNTTTTSYTMIDGVNVPASVTRGGTNPTALIQAGNLEIGSQNGGTLPFNGKIAQVAIYNAKVTQATILASMNQTLSGSETSLISAYSFNNSINDLVTGTANNLTAQGSAVATNNDYPFGQDSLLGGGFEYGIVMSSAFSTNTTLVVQVAEGSAIPTTGGITAVNYSTAKVPYGFPAQIDKWELKNLYLTNLGTGTLNIDTWTTLGGVSVNIPIGAWDIKYECDLLFSSNSSVIEGYIGLQWSGFVGIGSQSDPELTGGILAQVATTSAKATVSRSKRVNLASATAFTISGKAVQGNVISYTFYGSNSRIGSTINAICAYL